MSCVDATAECHVSRIVGDSAFFPQLAYAIFCVSDGIVHDFEFAVGADVESACASVPQDHVLGS